LSSPLSPPSSLLAAPMPPLTELLRQVAIFKDLDDDELASVAEVCRLQEFVSGEFIFKEGEAGNRLFLIVEGEVRVSRDVPGSGEEALAVLKAGALFGEMAVFDRSERSTDAISNGGTKCLTITRSDFEMLLDFDRELAYKVLWSCVRLLSTRLRSTNDSLRSFLAMSMF
jgi:CRP-like cAMP-binding protein